MFLTKVEIQDINYIHKKAKSEFEKLSGRKTIFTGGGGFLGYYFIKSILAWNDFHQKKRIHLRIYSSFRSGMPQWLSEFKKRPDLEIRKKDITKLRLSQTEDFDYIIHAASIASPVYYRSYPIETIKANIKGLERLLEYMVSKKNSDRPMKGMLFFSSSEIYGDPFPQNIPTPETYRGNVSCTGPRACYDESKRFGETLSVNYANVHNLPIKIARPFNNYGPGLKINDGRVIADFAKNILDGEDIVIFSDGTPTRTFCYVADAIVGYLKVLIKGKKGEAYNIGVENPEISMRDLAIKMMRMGREKFGYKGKVVVGKSDEKDYLTDCPNRRCPSIDKAKKELGYSPEISLDDGLYRSLIWYKENY